jgi:hypothetical protein
MLRPCERRRGLLTTREGGTEAYRERDQMRKFFAASENIIDLRDHFMGPSEHPSLKVEAAAFGAGGKTNVVLTVDQGATLNFAMVPAGINITVEVST